MSVCVGGDVDLPWWHWGPHCDSSRAHLVLSMYPLPEPLCQLGLHQELPTAVSTGWCLGVSPAKFKGLCGINILSHK